MEVNEVPEENESSSEDEYLELVEYFEEIEFFDEIEFSEENEILEDNETPAENEILEAIEIPQDTSFQFPDIPEILEMIFEKMDLKSLCACRRVNPNWNIEVNRVFKNKIKVGPLKNSESVQKFKITMERSDERRPLPVKHLRFWRITERVHLWRNLSETVLRHVKTVEWSMTNEWVSLKQLLGLIYKLSPNLEELLVEFRASTLDIQYCSNFSATVLKHRERSLPRLQTFNIQLFAGEAGRKDANMQAYINFIVYSAFNLKRLKLCCELERRARANNVFLSMTSTQYEELEVDDFWTSRENLKELLDRLRNISLRVLRLDLVSSECYNLRQLLQQCCRSLEELHLTFNEEHSYHNFLFGVSMKKLQVLSLSSAGSDFCIDWNMLPQLRKLHITGGSLKGIVTSMTASPNHVSRLETLYIDSMFIELGWYPYINQMISYLSSQLTSLRVKLWRDVATSLAIIFGECTRLTYLSVFTELDDLNDEILCGVENLDALSVNWPREGERSRHPQANVDFEYGNLVVFAKGSRTGPTRQFPFIGNLQELQILTLAGQFSALAVLHGVIHCANLKTIRLNSRVMGKIRATRVIQHAGLRCLTSVKINGQVVNHLP